MCLEVLRRSLNVSRGKKKKYKDITASAKGNDYFGTIYDGMCKSAQYKRLSIGAKQFYTICRVQSHSSHGRACLYNHGNEFGIKYTENDFVFPSSHLMMYGYDRSNAGKYFKELMAAGFIIKKEGNKALKKVNVYSFSDNWKKTD